MKAIDHTFAEIEQPKPTPAGRDLLVKVEAISVNPVDYKQRKTATSAKVLGWDAASCYLLLPDAVFTSMWWWWWW